MEKVTFGDGMPGYDFGPKEGPAVVVIQVLTRDKQTHVRLTHFAHQGLGCDTCYCVLLPYFSSAVILAFGHSLGLFFGGASPGFMSVAQLLPQSKTLLLSRDKS